MAQQLRMHSMLDAKPGATGTTSMVQTHCGNESSCNCLSVAKACGLSLRKVVQGAIAQVL